MRKELHSSIRLLNEKEVAKMIGVSVAWLQRQRWKGSNSKENAIPYRKFGHTVRYSETDVIKWIESHPLQFNTGMNQHPPAQAD